MMPQGHNVPTHKNPIIMKNLRISKLIRSQLSRWIFGCTAAIAMAAAPLKAEVAVSFNNTTINPSGTSPTLGTVTLDFTIDGFGNVTLDASTTNTASTVVVDAVDAWDGVVGTVTDTGAFGSTFTLTLKGFGSTNDLKLSNQLGGSPIAGAMGLPGSNQYRVDNNISSAPEKNEYIELTAASVPLGSKLKLTSMGWNNSNGNGNYSMLAFRSAAPSISLTNPVGAQTGTWDLSTSGVLLDAAQVINFGTVTSASIGNGYSFKALSFDIVNDPTPTGLTATTNGSQVVLDWNDTPNATSYSVYRSTTSGGPYGTALATGLSTSNYTDGTVVPGTTYYYVVTSSDASSQSGNSAEKSIAVVTTYAWTPTAAGPFNWDNASSQDNWGTGAAFPTLAGEVAIMNVDLSANQTVDLNQAITVGSLTFGDSTLAQTATLAAGTSGSLTFDVTSGNASLIRTATGTGATTISAPITLSDNLAVSRASGTAASTMSLSGIISESGGAKTLIKDSDALTLALSGANTFSGGVTILSGTVDSKSSPTTLGTGTLVIGGTGGVNPIFQAGVANANAVQVNANTTGTSIIAANGGGSGFVMSGAITLNSAGLNVRTFSGGVAASVNLSGGVTGTGNLLINNLSNGTAATGKVTLSGSTINNIGSVTSQGNGPTANVISAVIGTNVTGVVVQNSATTPLKLTAANLYTGPTTIGTGGTLVLGHATAASNSSGVTIADTGALSLTTTPSTVKTLTFSATTGTGKLNFDVAGGGSGLTVSTSNGVTNTGAAGSVAINITGSAPANGTYPLISYSGTLQGSGFSAYALGTTPPGKTYALQDAAGVVELVVSDFIPMNWTGAQSTEWSTAVIAGSKNWNLGGSPLDYTDGQAVLFDGTATNYTVNLSADVTPLNVSFNNSGTTPYTLQGTNAITGPTALTKAGSQTLTILNPNTYTGDTTISAGTLKLGGSSNLGAAGTYAGAMSIASGATFEKSSAATQTLSGAVTGGGTLKMSSTGGLTLSNASNDYGALEITAAGRVFINTNALALPTAATVSITNGGLLVFSTSGTYGNAITVGDTGGINARNGDGATLNNVTLPGSGTVFFNNDDAATSALTISSGKALTGNLTVNIGGIRTNLNLPGSVELTGILSGTGGSLTVDGPADKTGLLTLRGVNTFDGGVNIVNGTVVSRSSTSTLGTGAVTMGGTGSAGASYLLGQLNSNNFTINAPDSGLIVIGANDVGSGFTMAGGITLNGALTIRTFDNTVPIEPLTTKASANFTGGITGTGDVVLDNLGLAANFITLNTGAINHIGSLTLQGTATGNTTIGAVIGANVTDVTQNSATSTLVLSGTNTYSGDTTVNSGVLAVKGASIPDTGKLVITGGMVDLTSAETVDTLFFSADQQPAGTYSSSSVPAGATITTASFTGSGTLIVTSPSGPGPVDHFVISAISSPQTVGTPITGITITAQDASNATATSFTGTVTFSGTGGFSGTSASFTLGELTGVSVTPTISGDNLSFAVTDDASGKTGTTTITTIGHGPLDHFTITPDPIGGTQTVGTPITGITITAKDASNNTATEFTGTVTFSGTGGFTGTSDSFILGELSGVSVTPANAGSGLTLIVTDGVAGKTGTATITTIQSQYDAWAGGALFNADDNGDGVENGLAWILGAANPNASALGLLPAVSTSGVNMLFTFKRNQASINANTALTIDVGTTLASWPNGYNVGADTAGSSAGVTIAKDSPVSGTDTVTLTVTKSPDAKKFARLKATQNVEVP
jgi:fibronectin-binding autotransporter adhesin